jgi:phosphopantothenate synthetase
MDEVLGLVAAAAAFFLTKNPTLSVGARTGAIATAGGIGQIIGNLIQTLTADPVDTDPGS